MVSPRARRALGRDHSLGRAANGRTPDRRLDHKPTLYDPGDSRICLRYLVCGCVAPAEAFGIRGKCMSVASLRILAKNLITTWWFTPVASLITSFAIPL